MCEETGVIYKPDDSILYSIKKLVGFDKDYGPFDIDLVTHINSMFSYFCQLGVGPNKEFNITGPSETWSDFWGDEEPVALARTLMYQKTRITFDPPTSGVLHEALERQIKENEWRLWMIAEERRNFYADGTSANGNDSSS